jgi:hypothetical protein
MFFINKVSLNYLVISYLCGLATIPLPLLLFFWVFFISSTPILQMANTKNNSAHANIENNRAMMLSSCRRPIRLLLSKYWL